MAVRAFTQYGTGGTGQQTLFLEKFRGVDMTSGVVNVDNTRSPDAPNMMPDANGYPVKRPGYELLNDYGARINGAYRIVVDGEEVTIIHAGRSLYHGAVCISENTMADDYSSAVQLKGKLWVLDGSEYKYIEVKRTEGGYSYTVAPVSDIAKVPVVTKGKRPTKDGEGTSYDPFNLLTNMVEEDFTILETESEFYPTNTKEFYVSKKIDTAEAGAVTAKVLRYNSATKNVDEYNYTEGNGFTVDRSENKIVFDTAPGKSMPIGEDTVFIKYPHIYEVDEENEEAAESLADGKQKVNKNRFCILYGVDGAMDRIFMAGNPDEPNVDRWSDYNDPTFIGDIMYSSLGSENSPIMGYSVLGNKLVTHKAGEENDRNAFVRYGTLDEDDDGLFPISNVIQGDSAVTNRGYAALSSEPVFISKRGVFALSSNDLTGVRIAQKRSHYIDGKLSGVDLSNATAVVWGRFYVLAAGGDLYLLDTDQKSYESKAQASTFQYEAYYWPGIDARCLWLQGDSLCFGTESGLALRFKAAENISGNYHDYDGTPAGKPIVAYWTTPMMLFGGINRKKTVLDVTVMTQPFASTGGKIYYTGDSFHERLAKTWNDSCFDWQDINYARWSYTTANAPVAIRCGKKATGVYMFQVRVGNSENSETFGLYSIQVDYHVAIKVGVRR